MADRSRVEIRLGLPAGTPDNIVAAVIDDECERRGLNALMAEHGHVGGYLPANVAGRALRKKLTPHGAARVSPFPATQTLKQMG